MSTPSASVVVGTGVRSPSLALYISRREQKSHGEELNWETDAHRPCAKIEREDGRATLSFLEGVEMERRKNSNGEWVPQGKRSDTYRKHGAAICSLHRPRIQKRYCSACWADPKTVKAAGV